MLDDAQTHRLPKDEICPWAYRARPWARPIGRRCSLSSTVIGRRWCATSSLWSRAAREDADRAAVKVDLGPFLGYPGGRGRTVRSAWRRRSSWKVRKPPDCCSKCATPRSCDDWTSREASACRRCRSLTQDIAASTAPLPGLARVLKLVEAIGQRSVYFALLQESSTARTRLVDLCGRGDFLAEQIARHPLLLDGDAQRLSRHRSRSRHLRGRK